MVKRPYRSPIAPQHRWSEIQRAFTRFAIYAFIGLTEVIALFSLSIVVEDRARRRHYAPEWR